MSTRWQFSLGSLFVVMTLAAAAVALFAQVGNGWMLAVLVMVNAIWFCIIAGNGTIEEHPKRVERSQPTKEATE